MGKTPVRTTNLTFLLRIVIAAATVISVVRGCGIAEPYYDADTGVVTEVIVEGQVWALACPDDARYTSAGTGQVYMSICRGDVWGENDTISCSDTEVGQALDASECTGEPELLPDSELMSTISADGTKVLAHFLQCSGDKHWISGLPAQMSQCKNGAWTNVMDICVDGCDLPKDCTDIAYMGFTTNGLYNIIPGGLPHLTDILVWCDIDNSTDAGADGGWTVVTRKGFAFDAGNSPSAGMKYSMDIEDLADIFKNGDGTPRPQTFQFLLRVDDGSSYHATYDNVVADATSITQLGSYMGTAGDSFSFNGAFEWNSSLEWWHDDVSEDASFLGNSDPRWPKLEGKMITEATLRIRTSTFDTETSCPLIPNTIDPSWLVDQEMVKPSGETMQNRSHLLLEMPLSRGQGATVAFKCAGPLYVEPLSGEEEGSFTCEAGDNPDNPWAWTREISLPCEARCPADFTLALDKASCYYFSSAPEPLGIVAAAMRCMDQNASLAFIRSADDLTDPLPDNTFYFTTHVKPRVIGATVLPGVNELCDSASGAVCQESDEEECAVVGKSSLKYQSCAEESNYVCMWPTYCPPAFREFRGGCYQPITGYGSLTFEALTNCALQGASLAVPRDLATLENLADLLRAMQPLTDVHALLGLHSAFGGDFTQGGVYTVEQEVLNMTAGATDPYFTLFVPGDPAAGVSLESIPLTKDDVTATVCQFPGITKCVTEPPPPTDTTMRAWPGNDTQIGAPVIYQCYPGYFIDSNISLISHTANCYGQLGEWQPEIPSCVAVDVCNDTTLPEYDQVVVTMSVNHTHLNGTVSYACPADMGALFNDSVATEQLITCAETIDPDEPYDFDHYPVPCNVCLAEPTAVLGETDWDNSTTYQINATVTVTCDDGHEHSFQNDMQTIACTASGWETPLPCYIACVTPPTDAGTNMTQGPHTANTLGATVAYNCSEENYFIPTEDYPQILSTFSLTCSAPNMTWEPADFDLSQCGKICIEAPQGSPIGGNSSWDGFTRTAGTEVTLSCPTGLQLGDGNETITITCEDTGEWTVIEPDLLVCRTPVTVPLPDLPDGMTIVGYPEGGLIWEEVNLTYICPNNTMSATGEVNKTVSFNGTQWVGLEENFACLNVCDTDPLEPSGSVLNNYTGIPVQGAIVAYFCNGGRFVDWKPYYFAYCNGEGWNLTEVPMCEQTTPGPSTLSPVVLPTLPPYDVSYPATCDYHWANVHLNMTDARDVVDNFETTEGPFGFGQSAKLSSAKQQCLIQKSFQVGGETCTADPANCTSGFSTSVWEKTIIPMESFHENSEFSEDDYRYIMSTGGDTHGNPGVAIYHKGFWLGAIVSTGEKYWLIEVAGVTHNASWSNIGIRWEATESSTDKKGLELFVNLEKVGQTVYPKNADEEAQPALKPPEVMLNCHKTTSNPEYRGYNDGEYDELAIWYRRLLDNETIYYLGGYQKDFADVSAEEFKELLDRVDLSKPEQRDYAVDYIKKLTAPEPEPSAAPEPTSSSGTPTSSSSSSSTGSTASSPTAATITAAPPNEEQVAEFSTIASIVEKLTAADSVPSRISRETHKSMLTSLDPISNIFHPDYVSKWKEVQKDDPVSVKIVQNLEKYLMALSVGTEPFSNGSDPLKLTHTTDQILTESLKVLAGDLEDTKDFHEFPEYKLLPSVRKKWDLPYDRVAVPTKLFVDPRCNKRPLNIVSVLYNSYDKIVPTDKHVGLVDYLEYSVDSRVLSVNVSCNPILDYRGQIDARAPPCKPSHDFLKDNPIRLKMEHKKKSVSLRQLKFHTNEVIPEINQRLCAWFNPIVDEYGGWDTSGCRVLISTADYTKCACDHFGTFAIIAEHVEPRVAPPDDLWLTIIRYVGYGLSILALIAYIVIVLVSGDLKDMFHLIGLNLAFAIIFGSVLMLVSDLSTVRADRHICTALGALLHFCYSGAGAWVFVLGHSSFKAITSGLISGRLRPYFFLAWSLPIITLGLQYLLFMHDLGLDPRCFISWVNEPEYIFYGPQIFCCAVAFVFGLIVMCNMSTPALRKDNLIDDYGSFCYGASFVMIFFAVTWTFGLLAYMRFDFREPDFYPIFQVFNSCTGVIIFLFIGLGSKRFRMVLAGQAKQRRAMLFGNAFGTPTVPADDKQHLGSPADQRSKNNTPGGSGRASPERPSTGPNLYNKGAVAGRPGSRPNSSGF